MTDGSIVSITTPDEDRDSASFWAAMEDGRLEIYRCDACGRFSFPPMPACPHCGAPDPKGVDAVGTATVYSWATVHIALDEAFAAEVPYTVVIASLDEGPRIIGRFLGAPSELRPDLAVRFAPYDVAGGRLPGFVAEGRDTHESDEGGPG